MKSIVVGVNGSEEAARALRWSARLAEQNRGRIVAVRAVSRVGIWELAAFQVNPDPVVRGYEERLRGTMDCAAARARRRVHDAARTWRACGCSARVATVEDADLLVIGARHRDPAHGSTTRRLLKQTPCPLVVIPNRE